MQLISLSFADGQRIPGQFALAVPDAAAHVRFSDNHNPHLRWSGAPAATRSFVLICRDPDAPSRPDDVNKEIRFVPADLPRTDFFHWVMVDIPAPVTEIHAGSCSNGFVARGKETPPAPVGARQGVNDYTGWFAGDPDMHGTYHGYDGPCPPWNDMRVHRYHFELYATDLPHCPVIGTGFDAKQVLAAIQGHVLAEARLTGTYTLNPSATG